MTTENIQRRLAAILSADVDGYSRLMRENEAETVKRLTEYQDVISTLVQQHHGRVVDTPGDNVLAEFASVVDAVQGAVAIQKELKTRNEKLPYASKMAFRIGINLGDIIVEGDRIYGDGVNIAARLEGLAEAGGIVISRTAFDQIEDKLPLGYRDLGEKTVKNISKPIRAYKVMLEPEEAASAKRSQKQGVQWEEFKHIGELLAEKRARRWKRRDRSKDRFNRIVRAFFVIFLLIFLYKWLVVGEMNSRLLFFLCVAFGLMILARLRSRLASPSRMRSNAETKIAVEEKQRKTSDSERRYLRIQVQPLCPEETNEERVNIKIPLNVLKTGATLASFLPERAKKRVNEALKAKGLDIDLFSLEGQKLKEFLDALADLDIVVENDERKVRISCE